MKLATKAGQIGKITIQPTFEQIQSRYQNLIPGSRFEPDNTASYCKFALTVGAGKKFYFASLQHAEMQFATIAQRYKSRLPD